MFNAFKATKTSPSRDRAILSLSMPKEALNHPGGGYVKTTRDGISLEEQCVAY